ncbi:corticotropin-releasing factor receptor 1-like isoform X2 [Lineus longissimus]|uniref:corticotropin-releasing factor receptor 1-like isoform X2 n=1 Tax=Lineus longissimus TaxID=88925 RepID=UPI00315CAD91
MAGTMNAILFVTCCSLFVSVCVDGQISYQSAGTIRTGQAGNKSVAQGITMNVTKEEYNALMTKMCINQYAERTRIIKDLGQTYCNSTFDTVTCWPTTLGGHTASVACPNFFLNTKFDSSKNATKYCNYNGTWTDIADYLQCSPISPEKDGQLGHIITIIYYTGFSLSILALSVALSVFLKFRSLRCLRNTIHSHLMLTFLLAAMAWIVNSSAISHNIHVRHPTWICKLLVTFYNYLQMANYFWMFIEGLYLATIIVFAYSTDKMKFWHYALIGYGIPLPIIIAWVVVKIHLVDEAKDPNHACWLPGKDTSYDYIFIGPILGVLLLNVLFFATILYVLITKLRATNNLETRRKAARATLVLIPLLGITYVLFIAPPSPDPTVKYAFRFITAILTSTQGLWLSIFYCFLNGEVRQAVRRRFSEWHDTRSLTTRFTRAGSLAGSPNRNSLSVRRSNQNIPLANGASITAALQRVGDKRDKNYNESDNDSLDGNSSASKKGKASDTPLMEENYV